MDRGLVGYISRMSKKELVLFLQQTYGGTKAQHERWLNGVAKNKTYSHEKLRVQRNCTIARLGKT